MNSGEISFLGNFGKFCERSQKNWDFLGIPKYFGNLWEFPKILGFLGTSLTLSRDSQANWSRCHGSSWNLPSTRLKLFFRSAIGDSESTSEVKKIEIAIWERNLGKKTSEFGNEFGNSRKFQKNSATFHTCCRQAEYCTHCVG